MNTQACALSLRVALSPETAAVAHTHEGENLSTFVTKTKKSKRFVQPARQVKPAVKVWRVKSKRDLQNLSSGEKDGVNYPTISLPQASRK